MNYGNTLYIFSASIMLAITSINGMEIKTFDTNHNQRQVRITHRHSMPALSQTSILSNDTIHLYKSNRRSAERISYSNKDRKRKSDELKAVRKTQKMHFKPEDFPSHELTMHLTFK